MTGKSLTVTVSQVQAKSDYLLNEIARHGTTVIVTRLGKPLGRLLPHDPKRKRVSFRASQKLADRRK